MQAIAISVVLMSSACGDSATASDRYDTLPPPVVHKKLLAEDPPMTCVQAPLHYDSGKGSPYVAPLSSRRRSTLCDR
jgi:hypothetical protein